MTIDNLVAEFKAELNQYYKHRRQERAARMARQQREAFKRKYPFKGRKSGKCQVYDRLMEAGFSHVVADNMCRMVAKYHIDLNQNITQLLNAVKNIAEIKPSSKGAFSFSDKDSNGVGFQDNKSNSKGPDTGAIPDRQYPDSSYGNDYDSCVKSLSDPVEKGGLGVDLERAEQECATQWKGVGSKGGQTKSASIGPTEVPAWAWTVLTPGEIQSIESKIAKPSHFRSAADESKYRNYIEAITEPIGERLSRRANERVKSANLKDENTDDNIPYWARLAGFTG